jgi:hypothetical protein
MIQGPLSTNSFSHHSYINHHTTLKLAFSIIGTALCRFNAVIVYIGIVAANFGLYIYQSGTILIMENYMDIELHGHPS